VQLQKQLIEPASLHHTADHGAVLRLSTRTGNDVLVLRGPGDEVVAQEHRVARSGPDGVRTNSSVNISVDNELERRGATKKQAVVEGALEVAKDALHSSETGLTGSCMWRHTCWIA
jgi:hypothetical protein